MGQLLVRDVPDRVITALKRRAKEHGRSAEAEHRTILQETLAPAAEDFWEQAAKLRQATKGRIRTNSADLIRAGRRARDRR
jgi:plasmid stability protein